jgi:hypothetical protein
MEDLFGTLILRELFLFIGKSVRYFYYVLIGERRTMSSLSGKYKKGSAFWNNLNHDFLNGVIGFFVFIIVLFGVLYFVY